MHSAVLIQRLLSTFPASVADGVIAPHDCQECSSLREHLSGRTWREVPRDFVRANPDVLPLLSHAAYMAFLPAWLYEALLDPDGEVAEYLMINLSCARDFTGFMPKQAQVVVEVARFIAAASYWGPEDPANAESVAGIERTWSVVAV